MSEQHADKLKAAGFEPEPGSGKGDFYLMARDGEQCVIGVDDEPVLAIEAARFKERGVSLDG